MFTSLVQQLIDGLRILPGVGPKTAQRMAFQLLEHHRENGLKLAGTLKQALEEVQYCQRCRSFSEQLLCNLCINTSRNPTLLCIVETILDVMALEQTNSYRGFYFVLRGRLSPLDGIGPDEIGISQLQQRLDENQVQEIILATNPTIEGEATAHYIAGFAKKKNIKCTRIAYGVPLDGELGYLDGGTIARALSARTLMDKD